MTIAEVIPMIESLSHAEKFKLMQHLLAQLAKEDGVLLDIKDAKSNDPLWGIVGMAEGEELPVARSHDEYLYGEK